MFICARGQVEGLEVARWCDTREQRHVLDVVADEEPAHSHTFVQAHSASVKAEPSPFLDLRIDANRRVERDLRLLDTSAGGELCNNQLIIDELIRLHGLVEANLHICGHPDTDAMLRDAAQADVEGAVTVDPGKLVEPEQDVGLMTECRMVGLSLLELGDDVRWKAAETSCLFAEVGRGGGNRELQPTRIWGTTSTSRLAPSG